MAKHDTDNGAAEVRWQGLLESGLYLYSSVNSLYGAQLSQKAAALDADWQNTRALYDEAILADELLQGMAQAEVAAAAGGFAPSSPQFAIQALDAAGKAAKVRRAVRLRARVEAARSLYGGARQATQQGAQAAALATRALGSFRRTQKAADAVDLTGY